MAYYARLDESQSQVMAAGQDHFAKKGAASSAVIWGDVVAYDNTYNSDLYIYSHMPGPVGLPHPSTVAALADQNLSYVDGSVQTRTPAQIGLKTNGAGAGLQYGPYWWWF